MPRIYTTKGMVTATGRECTTCSVFKTWDNFYIDQDDKNNGHDSRCIECRRTEGRGEFAECRSCGDWLDESDIHTHTCNRCSKKSKSWGNGTVFLAVEHTQWIVKGGHFLAVDFKYTLAGAGWPQGMIVEAWYRKQPVAIYEIDGTLLKPIAGRGFVGDGRWLIP